MIHPYIWARWNTPRFHIVVKKIPGMGVAFEDSAAPGAAGIRRILELITGNVTDVHPSGGIERDGRGGGVSALDRLDVPVPRSVGMGVLELAGVVGVGDMRCSCQIDGG